ncbi:MAG: iron-containing alcohol dehydrogenase [Sphaerochaeta sp.]|jgi:alcohol dehydrogenase YqhD (iron-dependent ADH family)|nr:iron-containing alcohol dehydrogenase [Sphaerochaeta sp.]
MSSSFHYYAPTEVIFGRDTETQAGTLVKKWGGTKVLLHYGSQSAKESGLLDRVKASLESQGIETVELGGVVPNPRLSLVHTGIELARREGVDFLLAVGGGSVIDSAKAIGYGIYNEGEVWDFYEGKRKPAGCTPVAAVLTIAAAGSEMSSSSVITNEDGDFKRGLNTDFSRCKFAIMNPELTYSLPPYQTMSGAVDIMMHTIERYFIAGDTMALTDEMAEALLRIVIASARTLKERSDDYEARANLMWASSLSHNGLTGCGHESRGDWAPHQLEHEMGGMFDVAHGAGIAAIWGSWARFVYSARADRFARFGERVLGVKMSGDDMADARASIAALLDFFREIDMPTTFAELGIKATAEQIDEMTAKATFFGKRTLGDVMVLGHDEIHEIYTDAAQR